MPNKPALLIDTTNRIHQLWFGCRQSSTAVAMFIDEVVYLQAKYVPAWTSAAFDVSAPTFRHELFPAYKAGRKEKDPDLVKALELARAAMLKRGINVIECAGYEADDCIATMCKVATDQKRRVMMYSTDKDLRQLLVEGQVICLRGLRTTSTGREPNWYSAADFWQEFGFDPPRFIDYQCLVGDATDGIIGAHGIGPVTAKQWLANLTLDEIFVNPWAVANDRQRTALSELKKRIDIVRQLVTLRTDVPL